MENKLFFKNSKGDKLVGILSDPSGKITNPIIILCHGFNSSKNSSTNLALVQELNKNQVSSFRFDIFAHGESGGDFENITVSEAVDDILQAINLLKKLGYQKIGLVGSSFGGLASFIAASLSGDLYLLAVKCPVSSYLEFRNYANPMMIDEWKKRGFTYRENKKLNFSFYEDVSKSVAYDIAKKIKIPTLIVHGGVDSQVPVSQSIKISKLIPNCHLEIVPGADHLFKEGNSRQIMIKSIINFIKNNS
ncbi:MAG: hypothetical protein UR89_C0003G0016 [Candidatus Roizmanbacteria bacterium GW2011_GWA2_35_8]|uniref:Peptidase S9 prolyl oligopeptidase catalytic domain-containing protein n=1 Tax=Candidatus Roizmanbacteria bacterium GW2011_GWA2_35_8 TaxID=1618479 RepID=A0A0G0DF66_9BACT|nr:MAG: hypothetical protein UR89_C0003G0016 [Candidatus Roizmanbacteria bacterium GW2011_GWA2_35_8]